MTEKIKSKIIDILRDVNEDILTYSGEDMFEDGVIDSLELMEIVGNVEDEFEIEIDAEKLVAENFANMKTIIKMLELCIEGNIS